MSTFYCVKARTIDDSTINVVLPDVGMVSRGYRWLLRKSPTSPGIGTWIAVQGLALLILYLTIFICEIFAVPLTPVTVGLSHWLGTSLPVIVFYSVLDANLNQAMWLCAHGDIPTSLTGYIMPKTAGSRAGMAITIGITAINVVTIVIPVLAPIALIVKIVTQPTIGFIKANYPEYTAGDIVKKQVAIFAKNWVWQVAFNILTVFVMIIELLTLFTATLITRPVLHAVGVHYHAAVFGEMVAVSQPTALAGEGLVGNPLRDPAPVTEYQSEEDTRE
ncbi:hypothetical protein J8273_7856 [Carpediemonas membranifera]|uniref:Uncharacterized protein n=1 Tax=Carpediemonas membranifera TaxID=201153 RepID=A0A8J6E7A7_9EUKA|nr:hypothetical protein J8273_7856 [Carpediemonas membranifera]|eukprot:KAG9390505.1 hypothetical protein J8273_7856 [Carpediemonas membranifera]